MKINLNEIIKVKLTDYGQEIYYHRNDDLILHGCKYVEQKFKKTDENGYSKFQLWDFMNVYGRYMLLGVQNIIEPLEIIYDEVVK